MLKRLELVGFKSFADKTAFDFSAGVTAVVGPNGSGKSNVVDAVRWVLGEQRAKSLRSAGMADVIFNGSSSRRGLGMAEVTMTFDNTKKALATDAEEVQITRRVYRSGEGEYLINKQACRLKDVKELFLGSGAGTNAYSIIEQGRVDAFLQSSAHERRTIFEEAAGISRFKAKKIETMRKLERVDRNVERLRDIVEEVDKQLRNVRLQAAKAQRYQEHSARLKELRLSLGLRDYHELAIKLTTAEEQLQQFRDSLQGEMNQAQSWEQELYQLEQSLTELESVIEQNDIILAQAEHEITADKAILVHESSQSDELDADLHKERKQQAILTLKVDSLHRTLNQACDELRTVEEQFDDHQSRFKDVEESLAELKKQTQQLTQQLEADKAEHLEQMRRAGHLQNDVVSYRAERDNLHRTRQRLQLKTNQANDALDSLEKELQELGDAEEALQERLTRAKEHLEGKRNERQRLQNSRDEIQQQMADLRAQRSGVISRIEVLEGLERSHEGLDTGAREVFELMEQPQAGPWSTVLGIVADFLTVRREHAPLIDLALGERAQHFVVRDPESLRTALEARDQPFSGRVSFFPLSQMQRETAPRSNRLTESAPLARRHVPMEQRGRPSHPGVVALAEQVVQCDHPQFAGLPRQLLARTVIVRDLATARELASQSRGYRFITLQGELLEADGTLTVGTHHAEGGLLSRKSELRELREQVVALDRRIHDIEQDLGVVRDRMAEVESEIGNARQEVEVLTEQATDLRSRMTLHEERRSGLHEEVLVSRTEMNNLEEEIGSLEEAFQEAQQQVSEAEAQVHSLQDRIKEAEETLRSLEHQRADQQQACTEAQVSLAQVEERRSSLQEQVQKIDLDLSGRAQEHTQRRERLEELMARHQESQMALLMASASLAEASATREQTLRELMTHRAQQSEHRQRRASLSEQSQSQRAAWQERQEVVHRQELEVNDTRHRMTTLVDRLHEDYEIDLPETYQELLAREQEPEIMLAEIVEESSEEGSEQELVPVEIVEATLVEAEEQSEPEQPEEQIDEPKRELTLSSLHELDTRAVGEEIDDLKRKLARLGSVNMDALEELGSQEMRAQALQVQYEDLTSAKRSLEEIISKISNDSEKLFSETFAEIRAHFQELFRKLFGGGQADVMLEDENDVLECGIEIIARPPGKELRSISQMSGGERAMTAVALLLAIFQSKPSPFCILDEVDAPLDEANVGRLSSVLRDFTGLSQFIVVTHHKRTMASADVLFGVTMQEPGVSKRIAVRFEDWDDESNDEKTAA